MYIIVMCCNCMGIGQSIIVVWALKNQSKKVMGHTFWNIKRVLQEDKFTFFNCIILLQPTSTSPSFFLSQFGLICLFYFCFSNLTFVLFRQVTTPYILMPPCHKPFLKLHLSAIFFLSKWIRCLISYIINKFTL